jgi:D-tagatose-1,6-bisphosphate aldolase subunit GatZ/KbaZ
LFVSDVLTGLKENRRRGVSTGLCSVCSSHPLVIEAAVRLARRTGKALLVEATANQVNQHGGYTGLTPDAFKAMVARLCSEHAADPPLVVLGGDHLGPYPWRGMKEADAMLQAEVLVRQFVRAGARKIHLDASMALADDAGPALAPERAAARAVRLCSAAEDESRDCRKNRPGMAQPVYVIGTEVPIPGGEAAHDGAGKAPVPTRAADFRTTVALHRKLFEKAGLGEAWERVLAVVVQPGVEFDAMTIYPYRRDAAVELVRALGSFPDLVFEGHSTDYQSTAALRSLVEDGFAVLKVGPELTFTLREGLFGLAMIEEELLDGKDASSHLRETVLAAMQENPKHWKGYYPEGSSLSFCLTYAFSDRMRYYWDQPTVARAVRTLFDNLAGAEIPLQLISQFLPHLGASPDLPPEARSPKELLLEGIENQLGRYLQACSTTAVSAGDPHV